MKIQRKIQIKEVNCKSEKVDRVLADFLNTVGDVIPVYYYHNGWSVKISKNTIKVYFNKKLLGIAVWELKS